MAGSLYLGASNRVACLSERRSWGVTLGKVERGSGLDTAHRRHRIVVPTRGADEIGRQLPGQRGSRQGVMLEAETDLYHRENCGRRRRSGV
jgi:hypothetical protein